MSTITGIAHLDEALDDRTVQILEGRRAASVIKRRGWLLRRALLVADVVGLSLAFAVAQGIYATRVHDAGPLSRLGEFGAFALSLPAWIVIAKVYGLYDRDSERADHSTADEAVGLFHLVTVCTFALFVLAHLTAWFNPEFGKLICFWLLAPVFAVALRAGARGYCRRRIEYLQNTLIVGAGEIGQALAKKLLNHPEYGLNLVGFVDNAPKERDVDLRHLTNLGTLDDLTSVVRLLDVERVVVAFTGDRHEELVRSISDLRACDVQVDIVPRLFDNLGPSIRFHPIEGIPLVSLPPIKLSRSSLLMKRCLDLVLAGGGLLLISPLLAIIALAIRLDSPGPVFYRHERVGAEGRSFGLFKFRSMRAEVCRGTAYGGDAAEREFEILMENPELRAEFDLHYKLKDDPRVTRVGRILRRTSLDELPQLLNVLTGEMSLVGPRALTQEELDLYYGAAAAEILKMRPGITGYWQVNGRSALEYADRVRLDLAYAGGWSVGLDLAILARTTRALLGRSSREAF